MNQKPRKIIFHVDMDAFFASCAEQKQPHLKTLPTIVAYNSRRSIVTTANYEARKYGIKTAMPLHKAKELCPNITIIEPDYFLYSETAQKIWELIRQSFSPEIEIVSVDECFVDVTNYWKKYQSSQSMALSLQRAIHDKFKLDASIGISYNKFLAKMATEMNKPKGLTVIRPQDLANKIWPLPIEQMYGVGLATTKILKEKFEIKVIGDLLSVSSQALEKYLGKTAFTLINHASGYGDDFVNSQKAISKSISNEITLEYGTDNLSELEELLLVLSQNNLIRLEKQDLLVKTIGVYLRYEWTKNKTEEFDKLKHLKNHRKQLTLQIPTNDLESVYATAKDCFYKLYKPSKIVSLIGVSFNNLTVNSHMTQLSFGQEPKMTEAAKINQLIREINQKINATKVTYASKISKKDQKYSKNYEGIVSNNKLRKSKK